jgi:hypothetical protein
LLPKAIACFLFDVSKGNALARGNGRVQGDGTGNEGELQKPFQCALSGLPPPLRPDMIFGKDRAA